MIEQIRFIEASDLVTATLVEVSPPEDALVGRLLSFRALARAMQTDLAGTVEEIERAVNWWQAGQPAPGTRDAPSADVRAHLV